MQEPNHLFFNPSPDLWIVPMDIWIHFKLIQGILKNKNRCTMSYSDFTEETLLLAQDWRDILPAQVYSFLEHSLNIDWGMRKVLKQIKSNIMALIGIAREKKGFIKVHTLMTTSIRSFLWRDFLAHTDLRINTFSALLGLYWTSVI